MNKINYTHIFKRVGFHLLFWIVYILFALFLYSVLYSTKPIQILSQTIRILPFILATTYLLLYVAIPWFLNKKRIFLFSISFFLIPLSISLIYRLYVIIQFKIQNPDFQGEVVFFSIPLLFFAFENFAVMAIASTIKIMKQWYFSEHKKVILEKQILKNELEILQHQINPHFLFNILNNLYSLAIENNDEQTASGISKLSGLMRYNLYNNKTDRILLKKEVDYINNYIKLQEIRFTGDYNLKIDFVVKGDVDSKMIVPFIYIMFIENAFKHGISLNHESIITIKIDVLTDSVDFYISNFKNKTENDIDYGIGLENAKRRLEYFYPSKHTLKIIDKPNTFEVYLKIVC